MPSMQPPRPTRRVPAPRVPAPRSTTGPAPTLAAPICSYKWDDLPAEQRPERGLLGLRAGLNAFANLRPAIVPPQVPPAAAACRLPAQAGPAGMRGRLLTRLLHVPMRAPRWQARQAAS